MKILNLYAGIGGNRKLWQDCEITAIEYKQDVAELYQKYYPKDTVVVADAHEYLLEHFKEFDFIWSSPPCPTHSRINTDGDQPPRFPDMKLYEEIIMLNNFYKSFFVIENVIPYYKTLVKETVELDRHLFWSNFPIQEKFFKSEKSLRLQSGTNGRYGFNLKGVDIRNKRQILRNLVSPEIGLHIKNEVEIAMNLRERRIEETQAQLKLF